MHRRVLALLPLPAALTLSLALHGTGCLACNDVGCGQGFFLRLEAGTDGLAPGSYALELDIEQSRYLVDCAVADDGQTGTCKSPILLEGDPWSFVFVDLEYAEEGETIPAIYLQIFDDSKSEGDFKAYRGPERVGVSLSLDGAPLFDETYAPEYTRRNHRGDPDCGYCDEAEAFTDAL